MDVINLNILIAFTAGLFSFFSPCVLPLVPAYLASMGAQLDLREKEKEIALKGRTLMMTFAFILGFTIVFVLMGVSIGFVGDFLFEYRVLLNRIGGVIVFTFGLKQLGLFRIPFLERSFSGIFKAPSSRGFFSLFILGIIFSLGWSPCAGPVLASILLLAMGAGSPSTAAFYLFAYSMGLALPFLTMAVFWEGVLVRLKTLHRYLPLFTVLSSVLLLILGVMLFSGLFLKMASILS
jgi:cytochrome c-type biogenesis protein